MKKFNLNKVLKVLFDDGIVKIDNVFNLNSCERYKQRIIKIQNERINKKLYIGNNKYQVIENYFCYDDLLCELIYSEIIDKIMINLIDRDYVLISSSARNSYINPIIKDKCKTSGMGWHTDTRYIQKKKINPSLIYTVIIPLEDFDISGGSTKFISGSHKKNFKPKREGKYSSSKNLTVNAGSIVVFDSALWHKAGEATKTSRWAIFTMYGPWFMKTYFQFDKIFKKKKLKKFHPKISQLLHFDSTPPIEHSLDNLATLKRVREQLKN